MFWKSNSFYFYRCFLELRGIPKEITTIIITQTTKVTMIWKLGGNSPEKQSNGMTLSVEMDWPHINICILSFVCGVQSRCDRFNVNQPAAIGFSLFLSLWNMIDGENRLRNYSLNKSGSGCIGKMKSERTKADWNFLFKSLTMDLSQRRQHLFPALCANAQPFKLRQRCSMEFFSSVRAPKLIRTA